MSRRCPGLFTALLVILPACGGAAVATPASSTRKRSEPISAMVVSARSELELALSWAPGFLDVGQETRRLADGFNKQYGLKLGVTTKTTGLSMKESAARVIDEYRRGAKASTDVVLGTEAEISEMARAGALVSEPCQTGIQGLTSVRLLAAAGSRR